jgi:filamentous hemagglutinin
MFSTAVLGASAAGMVKAGFHTASKLKPTVLSSRTLGLKKGYAWTDFGCKFEDHLATTKYVPEDRLPPRFKTFDFFNKKDGVAISVKTMDTRTDRLRTNPKKVGEQIHEYIDITLKLEEYKLSGTLLTEDMIKTRKLELGIPTKTTPIQRQHILEAIEYGKSKGVEVIVTEIEY